MTENPFLSDEKLRELLADVGSIQSSEGLTTWKASFLKVYKNYLDPDNILNAREADDRLVKKLQGLAKVSLKIQSLTESGHITQAQITADGRRALGNWTEEMAVVEKEVAKFCPKTTKEMDAVGYDKYELGAVLIQDGFQAYEIMLTNRDFIVELRDGPLNGLLDKNELSIMDFYAREMQSFVDIMSDLGLFKLMTQCVNVYQEEPRPNLSQEPDILMEPVDRDEVVIDSSHGKDADCIEKASKGSKTKSGGTPNKAAKSTKSSKKVKSKDVEEKPEKKSDDEEEEEEPPPPQEGDGGGDGEKIIYFDPTTGAIGLLLREACMSSDVMFGKDEQGEPQHQGVIESKEEKENIVWLLKKLEKQKPKEGAWLEEIKKEKAARKAAEAKQGITSASPSVRVTKESVAGTKPKVKKPVKKLSSTKESTGGSGFKSPFDQAPPPKRKSETRKSTVVDYQGIYKEAAPKPDEGGWNKVEAEEQAE